MTDVMKDQLRPLAIDGQVVQAVQDHVSPWAGDVLAGEDVLPLGEDQARGAKLAARLDGIDESLP